MTISNKPASFFAFLIIFFIGFILYWSTTKPVTVLVQAGHEARKSGNTGAETEEYSEEVWNIFVANEVAKQLELWDIEVKRVPAKVSFTRAKIAVSIHFDSAKRPCRSGASIGYPNEDSKAFAQRWKRLYSDYFPYLWHKDNFTKNLKKYYAYKWIHAEKFLVLELGELSCETQAKWLHPRLKKIAHLVAYSIATELGKNVEKPKL